MDDDRFAKTKNFLDFESYDKVSFLWIIDHYDVHWAGLCYFYGKICYFKTEVVNNGTSYEEEDDEDVSDSGPFDGALICGIYRLGFINRCTLLFRKWLFEKCVGEHWTYQYVPYVPSQVQRARGNIRGNKFLFNVYYKVLVKIFRF